MKAIYLVDSPSDGLRFSQYWAWISYSTYLVHWPIAELVGHALFLLGIRSVWATFLLTVPTVTLGGAPVAGAPGMPPLVVDGAIVDEGTTVSRAGGPSPHIRRPSRFDTGWRQDRRSSSDGAWFRSTGSRV